MKKFFIAFSAVLLTVVVFAFKQSSDHQATLQDVWYTFNGTPQQVNDYTKYSNTYSSTNPGCEDEGDVCAILLPNSGSTFPNLSDFNSLSAAIQQAQLKRRSTHPEIIMKP